MGDHCQTLYGPGECILIIDNHQLTCVKPALGAALKVCKDLELFENWHQVGDHAATADELSKLVPCETALLGMRPQYRCI